MFSKLNFGTDLRARRVRRRDHRATWRSRIRVNREIGSTSWLGGHRITGKFDATEPGPISQTGRRPARMGSDLDTVRTVKGAA